MNAQLVAGFIYCHIVIGALFSFSFLFGSLCSISFPPFLQLSNAVTYVNNAAYIPTFFPSL